MWNTIGIWLVGALMALAAGGLGAFVGYGWARRRYEEQLERASARAEEARSEREELRRLQEEKERRWQEIEGRLKREAEEARRSFHDLERRWQDAERRLKHREEKLEQIEARVIRREERLEQKAGELQRMEKLLSEDRGRLADLISQGESILESERQRLEELAGLSQEQAREELMRRVSEESERFYAKVIREVQERTEQEAERKARVILATAIQRYAADEVERATVSLVPLPDNEFKGRIIGREGRNIRTFEALTGVDVLVDDTPDTVVLSCFNPVRREVARLAMQKLVEDGRIHPAQIKKQVDQAKELVEKQILEEGQRAVFEAGLDGVHPELVKLLGRLKFRTSYGQNQLQHSLEVCFLAGMLASELGLDPLPAKRAGLLHDIGKAVDHKVEGSHSLISAELAWRYRESEEIVHAIVAHNEEIEAESVLAVLIQAADTLSAARPGARQETFEAYIQRLAALEELCRSFPGVDEAYAIQAGREVRVMVSPEEVSDDLAAKLSYELARTIEEELDYPGEIKVHVIRSVQFTERAR
jgi:ribonuclease Y